MLELAAARRRADTGRSAPVLGITEASGNGDPAAGEPMHADKHLKVKKCYGGHRVLFSVLAACCHAEISVKHRVNKVTYGQSTCWARTLCKPCRQCSGSLRVGERPVLRCSSTSWLFAQLGSEFGRTPKALALAPPSTQPS